MSKLYGTLRGNRSPVTKCGHDLLIASAQSWQGSIVVRIEIGMNGDHTAAIGIANGSAAEADLTLWRGPLSLLVNAKEIRLDTTHDFGFNGVNPANKKPRKRK